MAKWLRSSALEAFLSSDWATVRERLEQIRQEETVRWLDVTLRLGALAGSRDWTATLASLQTLRRAEAAAPELCFIEMLARLQLGDLHGAIELRQRILDEYGVTHNPDRAAWIARACVLVPGLVGMDAERLLALIEFVPASMPDHLSHARLRGAALLRTGKIAEALAQLHLTEGEATGDGEPQRLALLALGAGLAGNSTAAVSWLTQAEAASRLHSTLPGRGTAPLVPIHPWLAVEMDVLLDEARAAIAR
jgi:hypothetical protein